MTRFEPRSYRSEDFEQCLSIFESNMPTFFAPEEYEMFARFLKETDMSDHPYFVLEQDGKLAAAGGLIFRTHKREASLSWGMVTRRLHRQKLGTKLLRVRLDHARTMPDIDKVMMETSQHTYPFYERFGFSILNVTPDGFGVGLDRYDMALHLR